MSLTVRDWGKLIGKKVVKCFGTDNQEIFTLLAVGYLDSYYLQHGDVDIGYPSNEIPDFCKPILRRIEDMTEEEKGEFEKEFINGKLLTIGNFSYEEGNPITMIKHFYHFEIAHYDWLDERGFDIRGWIDQGLAIDGKEVSDE